MKQIYHREITTKALGSSFNIEALDTVINANLGQDALRYQIGHDHYHFDANSFAAGNAYVDEQYRAVTASLNRGDVKGAREALGRLTHTVQDLYAHSNYVALWREINPGASPEDIDPELEIILSSPRLHSGKLYYPLEVLSFIRALKPFVVPLLPRDSHAWMNIDDPTRENYAFAFAAAVKRTSAEYGRITRELSSQETALLTGSKT